MNLSKQELAAQAKQTSTALLDTLASFNDEQFNIQPSYGGWTAGQVAEHLLLSGGVAEAIHGNTRPTTDRQPDAHCAMIAGIFLDFSTKLKSPDFIIPSDGDHNKQEMFDKTTLVWKKIGEGIGTLDLSVTCTDFEMPTVGYLTRLEWLWFYVWHSQRHLRQLNNIRAAVTTVPA